MIILETQRLALRRLTAGDAAFVLELLNDPAWLRFIGDRGVRTLEAARDYITVRLAPMYERHGFGLYLVELKDGGAPVGLCGLIKRDYLEDVDIGFAFLPRFRGEGYGRESAAAVMEYGRREFGLKRIVAITSPDNDISARLLKRLGFTYEGMVRPPAEETEVCLFASNA